MGWRALLLTISSLLGVADLSAAARVEPRALSVHPFTVQRGTSATLTVRGTGIQAAHAVFQQKPEVRFEVESASTEPAGSSKTPADLVRVRVTVDGGAAPGTHSFRMVTPHGISNALAIFVTEQTVTAEPDGLHQTPDTAVAMPHAPAVVTGRIDRRGESDYFRFEAQAGEVLTFTAISGLPSIGGPGGNANGFDPSLSIYETSGSWFGSGRLRRIAFNDEPLWVAGRLTNAHLVHRFTSSGQYFLRVEAFSGQGGPDYSYQLTMQKGEAPPPPDFTPAPWEERTFTRRLSADRLNELAARGGKPRDRKAIESYASGDLRLPATMEGGIAEPGASQRARFQLDGPQDVAIEVETPELAPPLFNPIVRLLDAKGEEVVTNIFVGRGACTGALTKSIQAKTIVPLRNPGQYTVEVRETTADLGGPGFRYRVQVRPQVPHVGQVNIGEDHVNLVPGESKPIRVTFDREEDYRGAIAVSAELLPPGVQALAGADFEPDKDPPIHPGKRERYVPRTERTVVVLAAMADAPPSVRPFVARLVVRPVTDGKLGEVIAVKEIPVMVAKP